MTTKRKLLRHQWLAIRTIDEKGMITPTWNDYKKTSGLVDNKLLKKKEEK